MANFKELQKQEILNQIQLDIKIDSILHSYKRELIDATEAMEKVKAVKVHFDEVKKEIGNKWIGNDSGNEGK